MKYLYLCLLTAMSFGQQLFISEYIEGSSNNKALEVYNPTGSTVDLTGYQLWRIANGGDWAEGAGNAVDLAGYTIAAGDVFVICNSQIADEYSAPCDVLGTDITYYNGDDAVGLALNGTLIDAIGEEGDDPGTAWDVAGVTNGTKEHTLVRKMSVTQGNIDWASSAGTDGNNSEWVVFDQNTFDYLGSHSELGDVEGCTDPTAANYNPSATAPCNGDNSCCEYASEISIFDIQYTDVQGDYCYESTYDQQYVTTSGVITAVKPGTSPNFYLQDFAYDTYAGIYVFDNAWSPVLGDAITVTAQVSEYYSFTELTAITSYAVNSSGNAVTAKNVSTGDLNSCSATSEGLEGMLVRLNNVTVTQEVNEYGEWYVDDGSGACQIDDAMFDGEWINPTTGQQFDAIIGVVDYAYSSFGVLPRTMSDITLDSTQPVANAGGDQVVVPGSYVTLDGTASSDPNGSIIAYEWTQLSGTTVTLSDEEAAVTSFTAPSGAGDLVFKLSVFDNDFNEATDEITITISEPITLQDIQCPADLEQGEYCYETSMHGETVITSGVVTAVKPGEYPNFYLQQTGVNACGGIYVFDTSVSPQVGDELIISGTVNEYYSFTQLIDVSTHTTVSSGNQTTPLTITTGELGIACSLNGEELEGMLVQVNNAVVEEIDEFGNWKINDGSGQTIVSDYFFDGDFPIVEIGDNVGTVTGVVEYSYSEFKLLPRNADDFGSCSAALGDLNGDGGWNVLDIVVLANCILGNNCGSLENACAGDINGDGFYNVLDIVTLANCILAQNCGGRVDDASSSTLIKSNGELNLIADGFVGGIHLILNHGDDFSFTLTEESLYSVSKTEGNETGIIIVNPEAELLFTYEGDFDIVEVMAANSSFEISVFLPIEFSLSAAFPNPFNPVTSLNLNLPYSGELSVKVYDLQGNQKETLINGYLNQGDHVFQWDASQHPSGMYFIKAEMGSLTQTRKVMLVK